jgi:hypothetical protein
MKPTLQNILLLSILLLTSACGAPSTPTALPLTGALSELSGTVNAKQAEQADFHAVTAGETLKVNGQVQTGEDGRVRIDLSSGTILRVAPASLFTLTSNEPAQGGLATKLKLELGRIYIILNGGSLDVETPSGVASVRGSYMMVEIDPFTQDITVTCLEGDCSAGGMNFTDGQKVSFYYDPATGQYRPPLVEDMNEEDFQKWLDENPGARQILDLVLAARPQATATPTLVPPSPTPETQSNDDACFALISPPSGALLNTIGPVNFAWEPQAGAEKYLLTFISPGGVQTTFETTATSLTRYIESMPGGGQYSWEVTAFKASNEPICSASAFAFSKLVSPIIIPPNTDNEKLSCTSELSQTTNPSAPCYCAPNPPPYGNPPYCSGGGY